MLRDEIKRAAQGAALVICLAAGGCPAASPVETALVDYMRAVQDEDLDRLYCLSTGASEAGDERPAEQLRSDFDAWARAQLAVYLEGRDTGRVELNGEGIPAVKLFALGRGTFFKSGPSVVAGDGVRRIDTRLTLGYAALDLSRLSPGTTFYLCGAPPGRVHPVRVPSGAEELSLAVLDSLTLEWTLVRSPATADCDAGWTVAGVRPVDGSAQTVDVTWIF